MAGHKQQLYTRKDLTEDIGAFGRDAARGLGKVQRRLSGSGAKLTYLLLALIVVIGVSGAGVKMAADTLGQYSNQLANPAIIMNAKNTGTTITDRNGVVLFQGYGAVTRHMIPLTELPESLKSATLATEDPSFYSHGGFSWRGTLRALYQDIRHSEKAQGGSTITQQLVKNTMLSNEKSFTRKYKELVLSVELERRYSKDQILQMYLNTIYYGQGAYGVESAAQTYFNKPSKELNSAESALLAGLPQSPSRYDPTYQPEAAKSRRDYVLSRMVETKALRQNEANAIAAQPVVANGRQVQIKAPHFVFYVLDQLRSQYGEQTVLRGGITVTTSLDYAKQQAAEEIVRNQVAKLAANRATNGGLVSLDPRTGQIISMVGSIDYGQPQFGAVNVTLAQLQPGSSFKPIAYAQAFSKGWNGATKVDDKPMAIPQGDGTVYRPQNYDQKFRGPVLLRRALANSLNIPALEVLQYAQIPDTIKLAHSLGIQDPSLTEQNRYGLSLVLGGGEVRPIDMAAVYGTLANKGQSVTPVAITRVTDRYGADITKRPVKTASQQAVDPRVAYMLTNILSDNQARIEEFGPNSPLVLSRPAAAKTGTTNDFRDNWTVGYTPSLVTAVWVGNNDHSPMSNVSGIAGAAPIWHDYMETALAGTPVEQFEVPTGVVFARVCASDGGLASAGDTSAITEVFLVEAAQTKPCGWSCGTPKPVEQQPISSQQPVLEAVAPITTTEEPGRGSGGGDQGGGGVPPPNPTPTPQNQPPRNR